MQLVYVSAPYTHSDSAVIEKRMQVVSEYQAFRAYQGILTVSPLEKHFILKYRDLPGDYAFWGNLSKCMLRRCDKVHVLTMPGWEQSVGVQDEIRLAKDLNMEIYYVDRKFYEEISKDSSAWE